MHIIWDNQGNPYVVTPDGLTFTQESSCKVKSFAVSEYFDKDMHSDKEGINPIGYGHRFDSVNHHWCIL